MMKVYVLLLCVVALCSETTSQGKRGNKSVYFKAYLSKNKSLATGSTLIFDKWVANKGNGYNPYSGVFMVPVSGIYMISVTIGTYGAGAGDFCLKKQQAYDVCVVIKDKWGVAPLTSITHLRKGEHVFVMRSHGHIKGIRGGSFTHFSGVLLRAD